MKDEIQKLRDNFQKYLPPTDLWDKIETDLEYESHIKPLLESLPKYEAPKELWDNIEQELPFIRKDKFKFYKFFNKIAAAIILLALGFGLGRWFEFKSESSDKLINPMGFKFPSENSDLFEMDNIKNQYSQVCQFYPEENPCSLAADLEDLEFAKVELENIIRKMGNSDNIMRQLRRIELEKTRIIRNMAQRI